MAHLAVIGHLAGLVLRSHHLLIRLGDMPPERVKLLVEDRQIFGACGEDRAQGKVDLAAIGNFDGIERTQCVDRLRGCDEHLPRSQRPAEAGDVTSEVAMPWTLGYRPANS